MSHWLRALAVALAVAALPVLPACYAEATTGPGPPPPPPRVLAGPPIRPGYVWVEGYWRWTGSKWVWVEGRYVASRTGQRWVEGHWEATPQGTFHWVQPHWEPQ